MLGRGAPTAKPKTSSPTATSLTSAPTSSTTPDASRPSIAGKLTGMTSRIMPLRAFQSTGFTPAARDADLPGAGVRLLDFGDVQDLGAPVLGERHRLHERESSRKASSPRRAISSLRAMAVTRPEESAPGAAVRESPASPVRLGPLVFVVGAASLGTEIAAARLVAPHFGASTVIWANTIATVLLALSLGYWLGGVLADRRPDATGLARLVLAAAALLAVVPFAGPPLLGASADALGATGTGEVVGSLLAIVVLVAPPVLLLGCVAPYAIRLSLTGIDRAGATAGRLYALSTLGSLAGVWLAALVLVPFAGTRLTFVAFALALAVVAAPGLRRP